MFDDGLLKDSINIALGARIRISIEGVKPILDATPPNPRSVVDKNTFEIL